jgi:hypothetical protein
VLPQGGLASSCRRPVTCYCQSSRRGSRSSKPTRHRPMGRSSCLHNPMTSQGVDPPLTAGAETACAPDLGPQQGWRRRGTDKLSAWLARDDHQRRSTHRAPPLPSMPHLVGSSPQPGRPPREEWTRATPPPSLPALRVVLTVDSGGCMAQRRKRGGSGDEIMNMFAASGIYIKMSSWPPPFIMMGRQCYVADLKITLSQGRLKCKKGRMMRICLSWIQPHPHEMTP